MHSPAGVLLRQRFFASRLPLPAFNVDACAANRLILLHIEVARTRQELDGAASIIGRAIALHERVFFSFDGNRIPAVGEAHGDVGRRAASRAGKAVPTMRLAPALSLLAKTPAKLSTKRLPLMSMAVEFSITRRRGRSPKGLAVVVDAATR